MADMAKPEFDPIHFLSDLFVAPSIKTEDLGFGSRYFSLLARKLFLATSGRNIFVRILPAATIVPHTPPAFTIP